MPKICPEQCKLKDDIFVLKPYLLVLTLSASEFARVTVIWASLRFGHPHSQNPSYMGIPCNPCPNSNQSC